MAGVKVRTKRRVFGLLTPSREHYSKFTDAECIPMAFQNITVMNASGVRAHERGCGIWKVMGTDIPLALRREYCADIIEHSSEFISRLDRIFSSETDWVGVIGAERLENFVRIHKRSVSDGS